MHNPGLIIFDGKLCKASRKIASAQSRGLKYGEGVFETFRIYNGKTFLLNQHIQRLKKGMNFLGFTSDALFGQAQLEHWIHTLLSEGAMMNEEAIVRVQLWQEGGRGYLSKSKGKVYFMMTADKCPDFRLPTLATVKQKRIPSEALPSAYKFTHGINYMIAARQAGRQGADDALMETVDGHLSETTIANIFWTKDGVVFTPSKKCDILLGVTRQVMINLLKQNNEAELRIGKYELNALKEAEAVWVCNSIRELLPVKELDGCEFDIDHPLFRALKDQFCNFRNSRLKPLK